MKTTKRKHALSLLSAIFILTCLLSISACSTEEVEAYPRQRPTPELSSFQPQSFYHHDGISPTAESIHLEWQTDGSVKVERKDVPLLEADQFVAFASFNHTTNPSEPDKFFFGPSNVKAWYIPFGDGPIEEVSERGENAFVFCWCKGSEGFCGTIIGPDNPTTIGCVSSPDCAGGCYATVEFSVLGERGPGVTLRATQLFLQ